MTYNSVSRSYLSKFQNVYRDAIADGATSVELASRPQAHDFLCNLWKLAADDDSRLRIRHEGNVSGTTDTPDWRVEDRRSRGVFFYGDHKSAALNEPYSFSKNEENQIKRYLKYGRPLFVFDGIEFVFFESGLIHDCERIELVKKPLDCDKDWSKCTPNPAVQDKFRALLGNPGFRRWTEEQLVQQIAMRARTLADAILPLVTGVSGSGATIAENALIEAFRDLYRIIRDHHDPSLSEPESCADFVAQVLVFGLFFAHTQAPLRGKNPEERLDIINRFWSEDNYFHEADQLRPFLAISDALSGKLRGANAISRIYEELSSILAHAEYLGSDDQQKDYHSLFERFFAEFDNKARFDRGVFYTPEVLTRWMVNLIDVICDHHYDNSMQYCADKIIDPCCGTGGFIESVAHSFDGKSKSKIPQLIGLEILPAPYALAHARLVEAIDSKDVVNKISIFLVDTLSDLFDDPPNDGSNEFGAEVARAAALAAPPLRIIIGNPPSSIRVASSAPRKKVERLMECFRPPRKLRSDRQNVQKALGNEAFRFLRWACERALESDKGIVAFVLPGAFLHSVSFQFARKWLVEKFQDIWILNLDADARTGSGTQSLFQVMQGRTVLVALADEEIEPCAIDDESSIHFGKRAIRYQDVTSRSKSDKEAFLSSTIVLDDFIPTPVGEMDYRFSPARQYPSETWALCWPLTDSDGSKGIFGQKCSAVKLAPSSVLFHTDKKILRKRCLAVGRMYKQNGSYDGLLNSWFRGQYRPPREEKLTENVCAAVSETAGSFESSHKRYSYRPYLHGWTVYDEEVFSALNEAPGGGTRPRHEVAAAFEKGAIGLAVSPAPTDLGSTMGRFVSFCWHLPDNDMSARGNAMIYANLFGIVKKRPSDVGDSVVIVENIRQEVLDLFDYSDAPDRAVLFYLYGILSSTIYLDAFEGVLYRTADPAHPPRIPILSDVSAREVVTDYGQKIAQCEEPSFVSSKLTSIRGTDMRKNDEFELTRADIFPVDGCLSLYENNTNKVRIDGIPSEALTLRIAGHDVVKKWLREKRVTYLRRTFQSTDLEALYSLLHRITYQQQLILQLDEILDEHLSVDSVSANSLLIPILNQ